MGRRLVAVRPAIGRRSTRGRLRALRCRPARRPRRPRPRRGPSGRCRDSRTRARRGRRVRPGRLPGVIRGRGAPPARRGPPPGLDRPPSGASPARSRRLARPPPDESGPRRRRCGGPGVPHAPHAQAWSPSRCRSAGGRAGRRSTSRARRAPPTRGPPERSAPHRGIGASLGMLRVPPHPVVRREARCQAITPLAQFPRPGLPGRDGRAIAGGGRGIRIGPLGRRGQVVA
jgi:hypothetical protein